VITDALVAHSRTMKPSIEMQCLTSATGNAEGSRVSTAESVNNVYPSPKRDRAVF